MRQVFANMRASLSSPVFGHEIVQTVLKKDEAHHVFEQLRFRIRAKAFLAHQGADARRILR